MIIAAFALLACHCEGRSSLDEPRVARVPPPAAPASTPTTVTPDAFADSFPEAFCDRYAGCCERAETSRAQCLAYQRDWLAGQAKVPGNVFDAGRAAGCLEALRGWAGDYDLCLLESRYEFASCTNVYSSDPAVRYPGERCEQDAQCEEHYQSRCALDASTGQRICQYNPSYDEMVGDPFGPCRTDLSGVQASTFECVLFDGRTCSKERNRCSYNHDLGQSCLDHDDCVAPLVCDETKTCVLPLAEGLACVDAYPYDSLCGEGLRCDDGVCVKIVQTSLGGACAVQPAGHCDEGTCVDGTCRALDGNVARACGRPAVP